MANKHTVDICLHLKDIGYDSLFLNEIIETIHSDIVIDTGGSHSEREASSGVMIPLKRWVIHDSDLNLLQNLILGFSAYSATGQLTGDGTGKDQLQGALGVITTFGSVLRAARKKRAILAPKHFQLLATLKRSQPINATTLAAKISLKSGILWTEDDVTRELSALTSVRLADGNLTAFASLTPDGTWVTVDI